MIATIVSGGFKAVVWGLAVAGFARVALAGMIAWPLRQPAGTGVDLGIPQMDGFQHIACGGTIPGP